MDIFRYYARETGFRVAKQFLSQAESTLSRLVSVPGIGTRFEHEHPALAGVRFFPVSRFRKYIVFYRPIADRIEVIRVLHGARGIHRFLAEDFGIEENAGDDDDDDAIERG